MLSLRLAPVACVIVLSDDSEMEIYFFRIIGRMFAKNMHDLYSYILLDLDRRKTRVNLFRLFVCLKKSKIRAHFE